MYPQLRTERHSASIFIRQSFRVPLSRTARPEPPRHQSCIHSRACAEALVCSGGTPPLPIVPVETGVRMSAHAELD